MKRGRKEEEMSGLIYNDGWPANLAASNTGCVSSRGFQNGLLGERMYQLSYDGLWCQRISNARKCIVTAITERLHAI